MSLDGVDQPTEPLDWLVEFSMLLEGDAAYWAKADPVVRTIISNIVMLPIVQREITTVKERFLDRYHPPQKVECNPITDIQLMEQGPSESLCNYYQRALQLLETAGSNDGEGQLDHMQAAVLDLSIRNYINGILDITLRPRLFTYATKSHRSLNGCFLKAEAEAKKIEAKTEEVDPTKAKTEKDLRWKMGRYIISGRPVPQDLIDQWSQLTKAEKLLPFYRQARLTVEPLSRGPKGHDATLPIPRCTKCGTPGHKAPDCPFNTIRKREKEERRGPAHGESTEQQMQSDVAMSKRPDYTTIPLNQAEPSLMEESAEHQAESVDALSEGPDYYIVPLTPTELSYIGELVKREEERRQSVHSEGEEQQTQSTGAYSSGSTAAHAMPKDSCSLVEGTNDEHTPDPDSAIIPRSVLPLAQQTSFSTGNSSHLAIRTRSHRFRMLTDGTRYIVKRRGVIRFKTGKKAPTRVNTMLNSAPHEIVSPITPSQLSPYSLNELKWLFTLPRLERQRHLLRGENQRATEQQKAPESSSKPSETASSDPDVGVNTSPRRPRASTDPPCYSATHETATAKKTTNASSSKSKRAVRRNSQSVNTVRSDGSNSDDDWDSDDENSEWDFQ